MYKGQRLMLGALGCLAIGIGGGPAVADSQGQAYIAGQLLPPMLQTTRGLPVAGSSPRFQQTSAMLGVPAPVVAVKPTIERQRAAVQASAPTRPRRGGSQAAAAAHPSVALNTIQFEFGSAQLKPESIETLRDLGNALNDQLKEQKLFLVAGHTDAVGSRAYNMELSQRRAEAVKEYLVHDMGVSPDRLQTVGRGSSEPAAKNPYAAQNRRVVVTNLGA